MAIEPITAGIELVGKIIDKVIPNKEAAEAAKLEAYRMHLNGELQLSLGQQRINEEEAKSASVFVAGWRPAVGWVCVIGLFYTFLLRPLLAWASGFGNGVPVPPPLDMGDLLTLLLGMLGLGGLRTFEKTKGVTR